MEEIKKTKKKATKKATKKVVEKKVEEKKLDREKVNAIAKKLGLSDHKANILFAELQELK